jgi:hypothetical protein
MAAIGAVALLAALGYLYDPPWIGGVTSGLRPWEEDPPGTLFRWTAGRASFYVPATASSMIVPMRSVFPGPAGTPVQVQVRDDGKLLGTVELSSPNAWVRPSFQLKRRAGRRRFRRIDLRVSRVMPPFSLGVMTGEVVVK